MDGQCGFLVGNEVGAVGESEERVVTKTEHRQLDSGDDDPLDSVCSLGRGPGRKAPICRCCSALSQSPPGKGGSHIPFYYTAGFCGPNV